MIAGVADGLAALGPGASATWVCAALSDADRAVARARRTAERREPASPVRMLDIPPDIFDRAYNGVANSTLWFVHHMLYDTPNQPRFGAEFRRDWESYLAYNEAFADALAQEALTGTPARQGGLRVLIQDYHLCLAPRLLRDRRASRRPGRRHRALLRTPPGRRPTTSGCCPDDVGRALLDGMLGADHAGLPRRALGRRVPGLLRGGARRGRDRTGLAGPGPARSAG